MDSFLTVTTLPRIATSILLREREVQSIRLLKVSSCHAFLLNFLRAWVFPDCANHSMCAG